MQGWIKLHRKLQESAMYKALNSKQRDVLIQCLLLANHSENEWQWGAEIHKCKPGQFICSLASLTQRCAPDVKVQSVRTSLLKLEKWGFLTNIATKTGRLITVVNWGSYQAKEDETNKDNNKEPTKSQQRANKELTTNKNDKTSNNAKNGKKNNSRFAPPSLLEVKEYCKVRNNSIDAEQFISFYESNGWMVGKNKMKSWQAAVRTWEKRDCNNNKQSAPQRETAQEAQKRRALETLRSFHGQEED